MTSGYVGEAPLDNDSECVVCGSLVPDRIGMFQKAKGPNSDEVVVVFHKACYSKDTAPKIEQKLRDLVAEKEKSLGQ